MWCGQWIGLKAMQGNDHDFRFGRWPLCMQRGKSSMFLDVQHVLIPCEFWRLSAAVQIATSVMRYDCSVGLLYWSRWKCIIKWKFWVGVYCKGRCWVVKIASVELFQSAGFVVFKRDCHFSEACQRSRPASLPSWHFPSLMGVLSFLMVSSKLKNKRFLVLWSFLCTKGSQFCFLPTFPTLCYYKCVHYISFICSSFFSFLLSWSCRARTNLCSVVQSRGRD